MTKPKQKLSPGVLKQQAEIKRAQPARQREREAHMNRVRAVQRRSAFERVLNKIGAVRAMAPLTEQEEEHLKYLIELRGIIRAELIQNGQLEPTD